jgi:hypothetical protein
MSIFEYDAGGDANQVPGRSLIIYLTWGRRTSTKIDSALPSPLGSHALRDQDRRKGAPKKMLRLSNRGSPWNPKLLSGFGTRGSGGHC